MGCVLMRSQYLGATSGNSGLSDVGTSQADNLGKRACLSTMVSAKVMAGRTQAALTSQWGRADEGSSDLTLQEYRSRGCRRARNSYWRCRWLLLWPLAPKKLKKKSYTLTSRFRPSLSTPANTSDLTGQGGKPRLNRPAPDNNRSVWRCPLGQTARTPRLHTILGGPSFRRFRPPSAYSAPVRRSVPLC